MLLAVIERFKRRVENSVLTIILISIIIFLWLKTLSITGVIHVTRLMIPIHIIFLGYIFLIGLNACYTIFSTTNKNMDPFIVGFFGGSIAWLYIWLIISNISAKIYNPENAWSFLYLFLPANLVAITLCGFVLGDFFQTLFSKYRSISRYDLGSVIFGILPFGVLVSLLWISCFLDGLVKTLWPAIIIPQVIEILIHFRIYIYWKWSWNPDMSLIFLNLSVIWMQWWIVGGFYRLSQIIFDIILSANIVFFIQEIWHV